MKKRTPNVFLLPKKWVMPFFASWRTLERTMNPAFAFIMVCRSCNSQGAETIKVVMSAKNPGAVLGIQCGKCKRVLKFEGTINPDSSSFPDRFRKMQASVLIVDGDLTEDEGLPKDLTPADVHEFVFQDG